MTSVMVETTAQLQCMQQGGPFKIVQVPKLAIAPEEVLIRQRAIALTLIDVKQCDLLAPQWPHVLGIGGAGNIEAVGSDVRDLQPATRSWAGKAVEPTRFLGARVSGAGCCARVLRGQKAQEHRT